MDCIFCRIVAGEIPSERLYEDDEVIAISDAQPQAPKHVLVLPRKHYARLSEIVESDDRDLASALIAAATKIGSAFGDKGFRIVVNSGEEGGQTVDHVHVHVLAGRQMTWPPG